MVLRVCRICGRAALTDEELVEFKPNENICKKCNNDLKRKWRLNNPEKVATQKKRYFDKYRGTEAYKIKKREYNQRADKIIKRKEIIEKYGEHLVCYFCGKPVEVKEVHLHSLDRNHENWVFENKVPAHAECHGSYHRNDYLSSQ